ncbi:ATP-binding protein [Deinococcus hopiensis]|uniref:AAA ATPase domain-containing protein n=1 Tax=Deinococcus hopiensis KR-140 TaxID=695939 RepID=A0A1W1UAT7_9DEIO|nr:AAA family ATPase [Deinococcus hopiensis]SMB78187.1 AAA ATPase domain-containing protein [Deinococcus hopiensis KR-140]
MTIYDSLNVGLLGRPSFTEGEQTHSVPPGKALGLLCYLALRGEASRTRVAGLLWSEMNEEAARKYLRQLLYKLRAGSLGSWLEVEETSVRLRPGFTCDALRFEALLEDGQRAQALGLYRGPLLEGESFPGAPAFEDWLEEQRERWALLWKSATEQEAQVQEERGHRRGALALYLSLLREDALQELYQRSVMRLHALLGEREAALEGYERFRQTLSRELQLKPLPETVALAEDISAGRLSPSTLLPDPVAAQPAALPAGQDLPLGLPPAPLTGREAALDWLQGCLLGPPNVVLVLGEPGVGKTRLGEEFWGNRGGCLLLQAQELTRDTPLAPIAGALRRALGEGASTGLLTLEEVWRREASRLVPELSSGERPDAPTHEGRARFLEGLAHALVACGLPLLADDLHWFDPTTLEVLDVYLSLPGARPLLSTARSAELLDHPRLNPWLARLERDRRLARLPLAPLEESEVRQLVQRMSGSGGAVRFCRRLHQATAGNPLFVLETLRDLHSSGLLEVDRDGWHTPFDASTEDYAELPLPLGVREAVLGRIGRLGAAPRRLLEAASLAGDGFALDWLSGATALSEWESLEALETTVQAGLLSEGPGGYRFAHDLHRRALAEAMSHERRCLLHRRLAAVLESRHAEPALIAQHLERGGRMGEAVVWRIRAAQQAEAVYAYDQALGHYDRAIANGANSEQVYTIMLAREQLLFYANDTEGQQKALEILRPIAEQSTDPLVWGYVSLRWARLHVHRGAYLPVLQETAQVLERLQALPESSDLALLIVEFLVVRVDVLSRLRRLEEAEEDLKRVLVLGGERVPVPLRATLLTTWTYLLMDQGELGLALVKCAEVEALARQEGQGRRHAITLNLRARLLMLNNQVEQAAQSLEEALTITRQLRYTDLQKAFLVNLSQLYLRLQRCDDALAALESLQSLLGPQPSARDEAIVQKGLAQAHWTQGNPIAATAALHRAIKAYDGTDERGNQARMRLLLARYLFQQGQLHEARRYLDEARPLVDQHPVQQLWLAIEEARALLQAHPLRAVERVKPHLTATGPIEDVQEAAQYVLAEAYLALGQREKVQHCLNCVRQPPYLAAEYTSLRERAAQLPELS